MLTRSFLPSLPPSRKAVGWGWPSAVPLWRRTAGGCGRPPTTDMAQLFISRCPPMWRSQHWSSKHVFRILIMRPDTIYPSAFSLTAVSSTALLHRTELQSHGLRTSCPFRLSPLTDEKREHNTMVRHRSIRLPETTAQITQEGHSIWLHDKRLRNRARTVKAWRRAFLLAPFLVLAGCGRPPNASTPRIAITRIPSADENKYDTVAAIEGTAVGVRPDQQIVVYTRSEELWWVQPAGDRPFTQIQNDSRWQNQVHLGTEYAALLVEPGYHPPETVESLPSKGDGVDAITVVQDKRAPPSSTQPKLLHFSGYDWSVRTAASNRAGTRNSFDPANAWTDERGALHLRIARSKDKWTCAEVKLTRSLGYGTYTFAVRDTSHLE